MGLPDPSYDERDNDKFLSITVPAETATSTSTEIAASALSPASRPDSQNVDGASATPSGALATLSQSIRRLGDNFFPSPFSNPKSASNTGNSAKNVSNKFPFFSSKAKRLDRQYIHCYGLAAVRLAAHGFVWLLNSSTRVSEICKVQVFFISLHWVRVH